ncbi:MAG: RND transporter [Desulforhopalus sp.]
MKRFFTAIPWSITLLACILVGFAPFAPQPHLFEKIAMLAVGKLHAPIDIFDLFFHASPFLLLAIKLFFYFQRAGQP